MSRPTSAAEGPAGGAAASKDSIKGKASRRGNQTFMIGTDGRESPAIAAVQAFDAAGIVHALPSASEPFTHPNDLVAAHNKMRFYTWGNRQCCLPEGAVHATLTDGPAAPENASVTGALHGQIEVFGAPGVLQICSQGGLTGIFSARAKEDSGDEKIAVFGFRDGRLIAATVQELTGPEAVYAFLAWNRGQFKFVPGDPGSGAPFAQSVEHLLLEGCRRVDESRQAVEQAAASRLPRPGSPR